MKKHSFTTILTALSLFLLTTACSVAGDQQAEPATAEVVTPTIPDGNRIIIKFGTSTHMGCMYSFSNCIWIGLWDYTSKDSQNYLTLESSQGEEASRYFGQYFPLTADFTVDKETARSMGIVPQTIPAGFYKIREGGASGQATGRRIVSFNPDNGIPVTSLDNPANPQDKIGQLHNLAVQVILHQNQDQIQQLKANKPALRKFLTEKMIQFLAEADLAVSPAEQRQAGTINLSRDFGNYAARLRETRLSENDKQVLLAIFDDAAALPVSSPQELGKFVEVMTAHENQLVRRANLDNPKLVLSMVSTLKNSRYFWYWRSLSMGGAAADGSTSSRIPDWVWADIIGMELGGPLVSAVASAVVYLDTH